MDSVNETIVKYKKELGAISSNLIEIDPDYREHLISEAKKEILSLLMKRVKLEPVFTDLPAQVVPHGSMPAFVKEPPKKVLTFKLI